MNDLIREIPNQLKKAVEIGRSRTFSIPDKTFNNVVISGLGGSGIGGTIISQIVSGDMKIPIVTNNDYHLPNFVDNKTLVIISSYSGNTEETLSALEIALDRGAEVACITSGGKVLEKAKALSLNHIVIPGGLPPRASFGLNSPQLLYILLSYNLIDDSFEEKILKTADYLAANQDEIEASARKDAEVIFGNIPIIYTNPRYEGVGIRFRQQLNENSKLLCWNHVFPEMNHNELVGWAGGDDRYAVIMFRTADEYSKNKIRMDISKAIFKDSTDKIIEVKAKGENIVERSYYLINYGDWISYHLAELKGIDATEVKVIDGLKAELAKH